MPTPTPRVSVRARRVALVTLAIIAICLTVTATVVNYLRQQPAVQTINYSQIYALAEVGGAVALQVEGATLTVTKADGSVVEATVTGEAAQHEVVHNSPSHHQKILTPVSIFADARCSFEPRNLIQSPREYLPK